MKRLLVKQMTPIWVGHFYYPLYQELRHKDVPDLLYPSAAEFADQYMVLDSLRMAAENVSFELFYPQNIRL